MITLSDFALVLNFARRAVSFAAGRTVTDAAARARCSSIVSIHNNLYDAAATRRSAAIIGLVVAVVVVGAARPGHVRRERPSRYARWPRQPRLQPRRVVGEFDRR